MPSDLITEPDVVGLPMLAACDVCGNRKLDPFGPGLPLSTVFGHAPQAGEKVLMGTRVQLFPQIQPSGPLG